MYIRIDVNIVHLTICHNCVEVKNRKMDGIKSGLIIYIHIITFQLSTYIEFI
jgi:hypothetical protein